MASSLTVASALQPAPAEVEVGRWDGRLFGAFRLLSPDGVDATPTSRKARALVAYLLASTDHGATRERLAGLLWSERGDDQARASLRQTFYELRGLTSGDAPLLVIDRTRVAIAAARVITDGARLDEAAQADDATAVAAEVGHHPGEFLADLDGIDPAFDDWLSIERTRRRDARRRAVLAVAERKLAADDADAAQQLADRLLASDPSDESAARIAMQASHRRGDRDGVRRHFTRLTEALQRQVGVQPSDETDDVYRRSLTAPRAKAELPPVMPTPGDAPDASRAADVCGGSDSLPEATLAGFAAPSSAGGAASGRRARWWTLVAAAVALLTVAAGEFVGWRNAGILSLQRVLLVEPIRVAQGDAAGAALQIGFSAELARVLVGRPAFVVRDAEHGPGHPTDEAPERTFVVMADTQSQAGVVQVSLRLLAREDGPILWSTTLARPVGEVAALREEMAAKVADVTTCALDGRHTDLRTFRPETLQLLLGACELRHADVLEAAKLLEQLTREMPRFSHGWAMLAWASDGEADPRAADTNGGETRTESYARHAIELDPHDGDAYGARALALPGIARWPQRLKIFNEGLAMDPDNADLALALALADQLAQLGYLRQAIAWSARAVHADPFSPFKAAEHATLLGMGGVPFGPDATRAFAAAERRFGNDDNLMIAELRFQALVGDHRRAAQLLADPDRGFHLRPERAALWRAVIQVRADPSDIHDAEAEDAFVAGMRALPDINPRTLEELSFLHRVDEAYADADRLPPRSFDEDFSSLFSATNQPLRADPRFMTLAARLGLVAIWRTTDQWPDFCSEPDLGYDCRIEANRALSADRRPLVAHR